MIIIEFEGLDKSGKKTQSEMLYKALYERGFSVEKSEFHRYDTETGKLIRKFLDGEYQANQLAIECLMAADKYAQLDWIKGLNNKVDVLIFDRYLSSQLVYSQSNNVEVDFILNLLKNMPAPDFHFYLDINEEESMKRKGKWGENDKYESNAELLKKARGNYIRLMSKLSESDKAMILDGCSPVSVLHEQILEKTLNLLDKEKVS
ncbi:MULTISPECIES: dTMP kinase [Bacillus subtilis group]|uniref:dTMP kinase n=1 Tax=Bacillus subtilis group TaxID=653685 RepID=UPI001A937AEC|nr:MULTISPECIES: dTMP kinase [Bacillus subtilis group]MCY9308815.1 dTMP kinase [Bacillus inaquosorum]BCT30389.1 hypothetical protein BVAD3_40630 [Bacillus velezensis]